MRRRLFDDPTDTGEPRRLLSGVPAPLRERGLCSLAVALHCALAGVGRQVSYSGLMGQSGAAFMLRIEPDFRPELALEGRTLHAVEALRDLGHAGRLAEPAAGEALALCREEIEAGRPLAAFGWGSAPEQWAVITGWHGEDLVGYPFGGEHLQRRGAAAHSLLALGPESTAPGDSEAALRGVRRAAAVLRGNEAAYRTWLQVLAEPIPYGPPLVRLTRFQGEQWLSACLADARDAGARYLGELPELLPEEAGETAEAAADVAARLAERAEELLVPPDAVQRAHLPEDPDWRQQRRELLQELAALESRLLDLLRVVLSAAGIALL